MGTVYSRMTLPLLGMRAHSMVSWVWKWCKLYTMVLSHQISPNCTPMGDFGLKVFSTTIIKTPAERIYFGRMEYCPLSTVPDTCRSYTKVHWSCSGGPCWSNALLIDFIQFLLVFLFIYIKGEYFWLHTQHTRMLSS